MIIYKNNTMRMDIIVEEKMNQEKVNFSTIPTIQTIRGGIGFKEISSVGWYLDGTSKHSI